MKEKKKKLLRKSRQSLEPFILSQVLWNSPQTTPESPLWNLCEGRRITTFECFSYFLDSIQISITLINVYWSTGCVQLGAKCGKGYQVELKLASAQRELTSWERSCRIPVDTFSTTRLQCSKANLHQTLREGYCNFQLELKAGSQRLNGQSSRDGCISRSQRFFFVGGSKHQMVKCNFQVLCRVVAVQRWSNMLEVYATCLSSNN